MGFKFKEKITINICVLGLWHLGSVTAACLASAGHDVIGIDFDCEIINGLDKCKAPIFEPGLDELIFNGVERKRLYFSNKPELAKKSDILWVSYDTPVDDSDRADVDFVLTQVKMIMPYLQQGTIILISSQIPAGTVLSLETFVADNYPNSNLEFAYSPENLRLGNALNVFMKPDRIIVGTRTKRARARISRMLLPITDKIEWMSVESSEMTKHAINAFLATSVAFANEIASICEIVNADAKEVARGLKTEQRIGLKAYISPGNAFAGGTLARDINYLNYICKSNEINTPLLSSIIPSNDKHKDWVKNKLVTKFSSLAGLNITIWGLTYKPGTDTLRRSLSVELCDWLLQKKAILSVHDPSSVILPSYWNNQVTRYSTPQESLQGADALIVSTEWPEYREVLLTDIATISKRLYIVDTNHFLTNVNNADNIEHVSVGASLTRK